MDNTPHKTFCEELLIPLASHSDAGRLFMTSSQLAQYLVLNKPENPKIFGRFENQVGAVSSSYKIAKEDYKIISILERNQ
jgi:hypothetical protein